MDIPLTSFSQSSVSDYPCTAMSQYTNTPAPEGINDVLDETEFGAVLLIVLEVDDYSFLFEPATEALYGHVHDESLKPITHLISLACLLLQY